MPDHSFTTPKPEHASLQALAWPQACRQLDLRQMQRQWQGNHVGRDINSPFGTGHHWLQRLCVIWGALAKLVCVCVCLDLCMLCTNRNAREWEVVEGRLTFRRVLCPSWLQWWNRARTAEASPCSPSDGGLWSTNLYSWGPGWGRGHKRKCFYFNYRSPGKTRWLTWSAKPITLIWHWAWSGHMPDISHFPEAQSTNYNWKASVHC